MTYGAIAGRALDAEVRIVAWSGGPLLITARAVQPQDDAQLLQLRLLQLPHLPDTVQLVWDRALTAVAGKGLHRNSDHGMRGTMVALWSRTLPALKFKQVVPGVFGRSDPVMLRSALRLQLTS